MYIYELIFMYIYKLLSYKMPKSIKMKLPFSLINFKFFLFFYILCLFGLLPVAFGYDSLSSSTGSITGVESSSNEEEHLFRHRHHQHQQQHHQQIKEQQSHEPYYGHRLEKAVDDFKKTQEQKKNSTKPSVVNLRHHRTYLLENEDGDDSTGQNEEPILQFHQLLPSGSLFSTNHKNNHHLRHHNRHHQVWEQRVFPALRHHPSTTFSSITFTTTTKSPSTSNLPYSSQKKTHYYNNNFGGRNFNPSVTSSGSSGINKKSDLNVGGGSANRQLNSTNTSLKSQFFDRDGLFKWNNDLITRAPKKWQSYQPKRFNKSSSTLTKHDRTFSDDNRYNLNDDNLKSNDDSDDYVDNIKSSEDQRKDFTIKKSKKLLLKDKHNKKKYKTNKIDKKIHFKKVKNMDDLQEYYYDDDDDDDDNNNNNNNKNDDDIGNTEDDNVAESESVEDDYNSNEDDDDDNNDDDDDNLDISNDSKNYIEQRTLPKRKIHNGGDSDDIYSRSYIPGTLTQQKYDMLGTHEAVKQSRTQHITNQRHHKALATAHISKITKEAACGIPKARVERIQRDTSKLYVPHCTILHRCGDDTGCCLSDSKTCVAKRTQDVDLYFFVKSMNSNQGTIERLTFKNHTECHCVQKSNYNTNKNLMMMEPAMLRKATVLDCNCPKLFEKVLQDDGYCRCDCSSGNSNCDWLKRGMEHFSMADRKCIIDGRCKPPTCEFGSYVKKHGRCPKKDDKLSYSRSFH